MGNLPEGGSQVPVDLNPSLGAVVVMKDGIHVVSEERWLALQAWVDGDTADEYEFITMMPFVILSAPGTRVIDSVHYYQERERRGER